MICDDCNKIRFDSDYVDALKDALDDQNEFINELLLNNYHDSSAMHKEIIELRHEKLQLEKLVEAHKDEKTSSMDSSVRIGRYRCPNCP